MATSTVATFGTAKANLEVFGIQNQNQETELVLNSRGDLSVAQGLPERAEIVRLGQSWGAQIKEANAFTVLITIPSTLSGLSLQNNEAANGGRSYVIDRCWFKTVTSTAAANNLTMLAQVVAPGTALVADSANRTRYSLSGKANYGGKSQIALASTAVGCLADQWMSIGNTVDASQAANIAAFGEAFVYGRYIVPPQGSFNLNLQESVSGGTAILGVEWHEVALALG